jgi:hypothetical protein
MHCRCVAVTLPLLLLLAVVASPQTSTDHLLPHVANGTFSEGSFRTTFVLFNYGNENGSVRLRLTRDDGQPLVVTIPGLGTGSDFTVTLPAGSTRFLQTDGMGILTAGAASVTPVDGQVQMGVSAIFSIYDGAGVLVTEAGVGASTLLESFVVPAEVTAELNTGLALFNPGPGDASADLILRDTAGTEAGRVSMSIPAGRHVARFVVGPGQLFPSVAAFHGTLAIASSAGVSALALRQNSNPLAYTSLPAVPLFGQWQTLYLPQVANGSFDRGSFRTSFTLLNPEAVVANVHLSLSRSDGAPFPVTLPGYGTGSSFDIRIEPRGSAFLQTDGIGPLTAGAATISSDRYVGAAGIFTVLDNQGRFQTEAGVATVPPSFQFTLPVDSTAGFDTGVALFNPGSTAEAFTLKLLSQDGDVRETTGSVQLDPAKHTARFVSEFFPGLSGFRGSLSVISHGAQGVAAMTLRQNATPLFYTTLPVKEGVSEGKLEPLLKQTLTGIQATIDTSVNSSLATGHALTGQINGSGVMSVTARSSSGEVYSGRLSDGAAARRYSLALPAGTYTLRVCRAAALPSTFANSSYVETEAIEVPVVATKNVDLPQIVGTETSGTVTGLLANPSVFAFGGGPDRSGHPALPVPQTEFIDFTSLDGSVYVQVAIQEGGRYRGSLPPGSYRVSLDLRTVLNPDGSTTDLTLYDVGRVAVGTTAIVADFAVPPLARLSGTYKEAGVSRDVFVTDRLAPARSLDPCGFEASYSRHGGYSSGNYQLLLATGRSYSIHGQSLHRWNDELLGALSYPVSPIDILDFTGDTVVNLVEPQLPPAVVLSGRITDGKGRGVVNGEVTARSSGITGAPGVELTNSANTDENGNFRLSVLSGSQYRLTVVPRAPAP